MEVSQKLRDRIADGDPVDFGACPDNHNISPSGSCVAKQLPEGGVQAKP